MTCWASVSLSLGRSQVCQYIVMTPADRAKVDMTKARASTTVAVEDLRRLLYGTSRRARDGYDGTITMRNAGGQTRWETHARLLKAVSDDPVFDKTLRCISWSSIMLLL